MYLIKDGSDLVDGWPQSVGCAAIQDSSGCCGKRNCPANFQSIVNTGAAFERLYT